MAPVRIRKNGETRMSLSRIGEDGNWFDVNPGYVYVQSGKVFEHEFNCGIRCFEHEFNCGIRGVEHFCEVAMRALAQSGELDDEQLEACENALRTRFDYAVMDPDVKHLVEQMEDAT